MTTENFKTSIDIAAPPSVVYPYLVDAESMLKWMGDYVVLDARPGGEFTADINGVPVRGRFVEVDPPHRVVLTWGHAGSDVLPPGASTVEIRLKAHDGGTRVELEHRDLPTTEYAEMHALGWAHYLDRLVVVGPGGDAGVDSWSIDPPSLPEQVRTWARSNK